jgi:hypothetical protein
MRRSSAASAALQWKSKWSREGGVHAIAWQAHALLRFEQKLPDRGGR